MAENQENMSLELREDEVGEIIFNIDVMLAIRKMSVSELADKVGITLANMSILKTGKAKAIKVSTLARICEALQCQPGDVLEYRRKGGEAKFMEKGGKASYYEALSPGAEQGGNP